MAELLKSVRGAITLDIPTLIGFRDSKNIFRRGIMLLLLVALVVGLVGFLVDFIGGLVGPGIEQELADASAMFDSWWQFMPAESAEIREQFMGSMTAGLEIGRRIAALPTRIPRPLATLFEALGTWVSRPLAMLGGFLGYGIWVMLAAKLLGGKGRLQEFLGTAALSSVPYLLLVLEKLACIGPILNVVAWIWAAIIWVVATAVTHGWVTSHPSAEGEVARYEVSWGKPILAVVLPAVAVGVLALIAAAGLGSLVALIVGAAQA